MFSNNQSPLFTPPLGAASNAVLWIFTPRLFSNQAKRPLIYNFDSNFVSAAEEAVSRYAEASDTSKINAIVANKWHLANCVKVSSSADHIVDMSRLRQTYTFMLVTDNDKVGSGGVVRAMSDNRILYYGHFIDEPYNPQNHMGRLTLNPSALLVITHKTLVNKTSSVGAYGTQSNLMTMSDLDIIHPAYIGSLSYTNPVDPQQAKVTLLRPMDLYASSTDGPDTTIMIPDSSLMERQGDAIATSSDLYIPQQHIKKILDATSEAKGSQVAKLTSGRGMTSGFPALNMGRHDWRQLVEQNLNDGACLTVNEFGLPVNRNLQLSSVIQRYNPRIEPVRPNHTPDYNPSDQTTISLKNAFSAMLSSIIPPIMTEHLLVTVSFEYNSHTNQLKLFDGKDSIATICPMHPEHTRQQVVGFIHRLKNDVFPIIRSNNGEFILNMFCSRGSVTYLNLNFMDEIAVNSDVFEVPTILGGLTSNMVGTTSLFTRNATELSHLIGNMVEHDTDRRPYLSDLDNNQFNQNLLSYDSTTGNQSTSSSIIPSETNRWNL